MSRPHVGRSIIEIFCDDKPADERKRWKNAHENKEARSVSAVTVHAGTLKKANCMNVNILNMSKQIPVIALGVNVILFSPLNQLLRLHLMHAGSQIARKPPKKKRALFVPPES